MIDAEEARRLFSYEVSSGNLIRKTEPSYRNKVGDIAGYICKTSGYRKVTVRGRKYPAHRIIWLLVYGCWPEHEVDHINGDKADNRLHNLRDVPHRLNVQNLRAGTSSSSTGVLGVGPHGDRWRARIRIDGKSVSLGRYSTKHAAQQAYIDAKRLHHAGCTI